MNRFVELDQNFQIQILFHVRTILLPVLEIQYFLERFSSTPFFDNCNFAKVGLQIDLNSQIRKLVL